MAALHAQRQQVVSLGESLNDCWQQILAAYPAPADYTPAAGDIWYSSAPSSRPGLLAGSKPVGSRYSASAIPQCR